MSFRNRIIPLSRFVLPSLAAAALAHGSVASGQALTISYDQAVYEPGEAALLTVTSAPNSFFVLAVDFDPGPTTITLFGQTLTLDLGFSSSLLVFPVMQLDQSGTTTLLCPAFDCGDPVLDMPLSTQAVGFRVPIGTIVVSNSLALTYDDPNNVCGMDCTGRIGDFVFEDSNVNNVQDPSEPGIPGVTVTLCDPETGIELQSTVTDANGLYIFEDLCAGCYSVKVDNLTIPNDISPVLCEFGSDFTIDSDCSPKKVVLDNDFDEDLDTDFGYAPCDECKGGVTSLSLRYDGDTAAVITIDSGNVNAFSGTVQPGEIFNIFGSESDGKFDNNNLDITIDGVVSEEIHVSCSQPIGPGLSFGDLTVVAGTSKDNGVICDSSKDVCVGDIQALTICYTGEDCSASSNTQAADKVDCSGDPMFTSPVEIVARNKNGDKIYFSGQVNLGDSFLLDSGLAGDDKLESETFIDVFDLSGNLLQSVEFHTSCSQPLLLGDQFGSMLLKGFCTKDEQCPGSVGENDVCKSSGKPVTLTMTYTADDCSATMNTQDSGKVDCMDFGTLPMTVDIVARDSGGGRIFFSGTVNTGEAFVIDAAMAGENELESATFVDIFDTSGNLLQAIEFHTSCSQPLFIGDQFGAVRVDAFSK